MRNNNSSRFGKFVEIHFSEKVYKVALTFCNLIVKLICTYFTSISCVLHLVYMSINMCLMQCHIHQLSVRVLLLKCSDFAGY